VTLDNAPANAYDTQILWALRGVIEQVRDDDAVRCVVIRSALEKFFSAGADISTLQESSPAQFANLLTVAHETMELLENTPKVIIASIAGHAMGGGLELALACDLRFAKEGRYRLGLVEINLGLNPAMGGTQRLPRLIGRSRALHMIATGETVDVARAAELGIVDRVFPAEAFEAGVMDYAVALASGPSLAQGLAKLSINRGLEGSLSDALALERAHQNLLFKSQDAAEGVAAFIEKRKAAFKGC
jgi:enoyl-CoA hydratase/carnithine racemase